jgi:hypothetical protein
MKYQIKSPDGFTIDFEKPFYTSKKAVKQALERFTDNYKAQGYYSQVCYNGYIRRIPLNELQDYCDIITI